MKGIKAKERTEVSFSYLQSGVAGYTPSCSMYALATWDPYIETEPSSTFPVFVSGLILSTPKEVPSVAINREVGEVPIVILEYEDGFTVYPLEIDGVVSQGDTLPQAIHNVNDAISLHIESFGKKKLIPKDERAIRVFVSKTRIAS